MPWTLKARHQDFVILQLMPILAVWRRYFSAQPKVKGRFLVRDSPGGVTVEPPFPIPRRCGQEIHRAVPVLIGRGPCRRVAAQRAEQDRHVR